MDVNVSVEDLVRDFPEAVEFLRTQGILCVLCGEPVWGTFAELLATKGLDREQAENLLRKIEQLKNSQSLNL